MDARIIFCPFCVIHGNMRHSTSMIHVLKLFSHKNRKQGKVE